MVALRSVRADTGFYIGENVGQFAQNIRSKGFLRNIVSFDPLLLLMRLTAAGSRGSAWLFHQRCAVGGIVGEIGVNISGGSVSSSVLMLAKYTSGAAG